MRLICPRCGAQYELEAAAIPASGREVECSACDHVWRARPSAPGFDPAERPALNRELSESVVGILREEAARELQARAAEKSERAPLADGALAPAAIPAQPPGPAAAPGDIARPAALDWGPGGDTLPADAPYPPSGDGADIAGRTDGTGAWQPATARGAQDVAGPIRAAHGAIAPVAPAPPPLPAAQTQPAITVATAAEPPPARRIPARTAVQSADMPVTLHQSLPSAASPTPHQSNAAAQRKSRSSYAIGFRLAVIAALAALALYALTPRLADQGAIGLRLAEWRAGVDQGRDWLAARADALVGRIRAAD